MNEDIKELLVFLIVIGMANLLTLLVVMIILANIAHYLKIY